MISQGLMQAVPLTVGGIVERMETLYAHKKVTVLRNGTFERASFGQLAHRARKVAGWLQGIGLQPGDCVSTLLWNCHEHLELFLGVPAGGFVLHTANVRLPPASIATMLAETSPKVLVVDESMLPLLAEVELPAGLLMIALVGSSDAAKNSAQFPGKRLQSYLASIDVSHGAEWPDLSETAACGVCYTSGTSGKAKGVVYSHRSTLLHAMSMLFTDTIALSEHDTCLPVVPMFHAQGWGFPYAACLCGANIALSYRVSDPASLTLLIEEAKVTMATAVPTVWIAVLEALRKGEIAPERLVTLKRLPIGGATVSADLLTGFDQFGIEVQHCWGMTEVSPLGLVSTRRAGITDAQWQELRRTPGLPPVGCEVRVITDKGVDAPRDGMTPGELQIRGPWVADAYFDPGAEDGRGSEASFVVDGKGRRWLKTADVATWNAIGYVRIVDRYKDLIKSGGEWISSLELESALASHPAVSEAAVIPVPDAVWQERPVAYVCLVQQWQGPQPDLAGYLVGRLPKWQVPDRFIFLQELPRGATGKVDKQRLRSLSGSA
ncbi:long-chain fatty acid--CoA ligase [Caenimonas sedimenti]|uniref:Long-chain fatty acid--CoA ligase n=1 Tax=Caenimonas sedimenti TaxID=2596921 RepID=A0A562ZDI5_9BURK|nr:AMP-binding protein [Caenimonas sedimenti]TWO64433.1 long-chain fatty acid--CoA ligase [Caenimonas sedimenti]